MMWQVVQRLNAAQSTRPGQKVPRGLCSHRASTGQTCYAYSSRFLLTGCWHKYFLAQRFAVTNCLLISRGPYFPPRSTKHRKHYVSQNVDQRHGEEENNCSHFWTTLAHATKPNRPTQMPVTLYEGREVFGTKSCSIFWRKPTTHLNTNGLHVTCTDSGYEALPLLLFLQDLFHSSGLLKENPKHIELTLSHKPVSG